MGLRPGQGAARGEGGKGSLRGGELPISGACRKGKESKGRRESPEEGAWLWPGPQPPGTQVLMGDTQMGWHGEGRGKHGDTPSAMAR